MVYGVKNNCYQEFNSRCLCEYHRLKLVYGLQMDANLRRISVTLYISILVVKLRYMKFHLPKWKKKKSKKENSTHLKKFIANK